MITEQMTAQEVFEKYRDDMVKLIEFLPWLEKCSGKVSVANMYSGNEDGNKTIPFPVYDSNLLRFVKVAGTTSFIDRNYVYVISRNRLKTVSDELMFIDKQTMLQLDSIGAVLAKYVIGGQTKGRMWSQAVDDCIFLAIVKKMKELYDLGINGLTE